MTAARYAIRTATTLARGAPARPARDSATRPPDRTGARPRSLEWGLCAGSVLVAFLGAEVVLGFAPTTASRVLTPSDRRLTVSLDCYPTNPRGYFDLDVRDPAVRGRLEGLRVRRVGDCAERAPHAVELRYNSMQFREREPGPKRPGVRRVVVLGDSFTEGQGVKEPDVYPRVLERALNERGAAEWEVLNFGHRGADFPVLRDTFERVLELDPDVVVYGMMLNDCEQSPGFRARHRRLSDRLTGRSRQERDPTPDQAFGRRTASFVRHRLERLRTRRQTIAWYADLYAVPNREGWERTQEHLRHMDRAMRLRGGQFLVATWPVLVDLEGAYPLSRVHQTIGRFCHVAGIPWVDLLPALQERAASDLWVHPIDAHPNEIAHALAGQRLSPVARALVEGRS